MDDSTLFAGLRNDGPNRQRFENQLYDRYAYFIREATRTHRLPHDDCATAYADTVLTVIEHIQTGRFGGRSGLKTYLYKIFYNKCVDIIRKNTTNRESVHYGTVSLDESLHDLPGDVQLVVQQLIQEQDIEQLHQNLNALGEKCREMLLAWGDDQTDAEIARRLAYNSAGVAKTSRLRCLEKLKAIYDQPL
jgi:RNA polymerase sigma factor (sigma-70 family)